MNKKIYTLIFLGLVEHIAEEHGEELRRLCLVCAEAVEDSEGGWYGVQVSIIFTLSTEARKRYPRKSSVEVKTRGMQA
jgi:hypothetical protein